VNRDALPAGIRFRELANGFLVCEVPGTRAIEVWRQLRDATAKSGAYPIIVDEARDAGNAEPADDAPVNVSVWIAERFEELALDLGEDDPESVVPRGPWPEGASPSTDYYSVKKPAVTIALLPTSDPANVPLLLGYGGWNDCPMPEVHGAFFRYWGETYGAEPVVIARDVIEMTVGRPPLTRDAALALAREQYAYAADIVDQGTETIDALAAEIIGQPRWFFWWD